MVNSTWTKNHIDSLLAPSISPVSSSAVSKKAEAEQREAEGQSEGVTLVYPPCDTRQMTGFSLDNRERIVMSLAQFRPEKDHALQLRALAVLFEQHPIYKTGTKTQRIQLVLVGSSRDEGDALRVKGLEALAAELDLTNNVTFVLNATYPVLLDWLRRSSVGLHSMRDEHFGINIVEFMVGHPHSGTRAIADSVHYDS